ncbi:PadR family transcriptional regulator [Paenibacillus sp. NPDC058177]|uniref:PadR family transcriptional regulator n=1 Tax=Paenibacillus sp. NPDC058177 TaxID=3346369 RepID=UPI0036DC9CF3
MNSHTANSDDENLLSASSDHPEPLELTPTAWTILGFLSLQPRSGYEIREAAKRSVGFFWGISDGQLYPQLKVLEGLELIEAFNGIEGPRSRQRWKLTTCGRCALRTWLSTPSAPIQIRDENLVKFLFASQEEPELLLNLIKERRNHFEWFLRSTQGIQPGAAWDIPGSAASLTGPLLLQQYGKEFSETVLQWCDRAETALSPTNRPHSPIEEE